MPVTVVARRRVPGMSTRSLRACAQRAMAFLGESEADVCVTLVGDAEIQVLNREYRRKDAPTDVLAFATREGERVPGDEASLGDIVISVDTARRQAAARGRALERELVVLVLHGLLHLVGYDHERSPAEARRMRRQEKRLARLLGIL